jgi:hypothetical protein
MKHILINMGLFLSVSLAQPIPTDYFTVEQADSFYYLLTDKALFKFYSHEASGEFFLTNYIEKSFPSTTRITLMKDYLFTSNGDTISYYLNRTAWELEYVNKFISEYHVASIHGFGPYFFIRSGNIYHLYKIENNLVVNVEDSLFNHPDQYLVFFTYPFVVIGQTVYKYIEEFDFYAVCSIPISNVNLGITGNKIIGYYYWISGTWPSIVEHSVLNKFIIEEPYFPYFTDEGWGMNITQLHQNFGNGTLIAKENLYYMTWRGVITTFNSQLAYLPTQTDEAKITDYYIFLLGGDTFKFSRWYAGSTFYPFTWINLTNVEQEQNLPVSYSLLQNFPNPFNPTTIISFEISEANFISLIIYNTLSEEIETLLSEVKQAGHYEIEFDGGHLPSGTYFYRLQSEDFAETKKMILLR